MSARAEARPPAREGLERAWWLRVPAVLIAPRAVFVAIRDESREAVEARQEPVAAMVALAGGGGVLFSHAARTFLNDGANSGIVVPVWIFIAGAINAIFAYWALGALVYIACRALGSLGSYRRARHVVGFASAPIALSLLVFWPVRIGVYGVDLFRSGGNDYGRGDMIFGWVGYGFVAWSVVLLAIGIRAVHGWTWPRAAGALALTALLPALLTVQQLL